MPQMGGKAELGRIGGQHCTDSNQVLTNAGCAIAGKARLALAGEGAVCVTALGVWGTGVAAAHNALIIVWGQVNGVERKWEGGGMGDMDY